jgi:hypothetical protein
MHLDLQVVGQVGSSLNGTEDGKSLSPKFEIGMTEDVDIRVQTVYAGIIVFSTLLTVVVHA